MSHLPCYLWTLILGTFALLGAFFHYYLHQLWHRRIADCLVSSPGVVKSLLLHRVSGYFSSILFGSLLSFSILLLVYTGHRALYWFTLLNLLAVFLLFKPLERFFLRYTYPDAALVLTAKYLPLMVVIPLSILYGLYLFNTAPLELFIPTPEAAKFERHLFEVYIEHFGCTPLGWFIYSVKLLDYTLWSLQLVVAKEFPSVFPFAAVYLLIKEGLSVWVLDAFLAKFLAYLEARRLKL